MKSQDHLNILNNVSFLQYLSEEELARFLEEGTVQSLKKGQIVFEDGDPGESMFIILSGSVEIFKENKQIALRISSDYFGEMSILDCKPRSAGARAFSDCELFKITRKQFKTFLENKPYIVKEFLITISERCRKDLEIIDAGFLALFQSEERYRTIVETISDIIMQLDPFGNIVYINAAIRHIGYEPEDLIGKPVELILGKSSFKESGKLLTTRRVGPRATSNLEMNFVVSPDSPLSEFAEEMTYLVDAHGVWNVKNETVIKQGGEGKVYLGTLCIARDITQRKLLEDNLKKKKEELETQVKERTIHLEEMIQVAKKANQAKNDFLSRMSHELRTPLNAILGFSQLMLYDSETGLEEKETQFVENIHEAGTHLLSLISDLMDLSQIETGNLKLHMVDVELNPLIDNLCNFLEGQVKENDLKLENTLENSENFLIRADKTRLKQVLLNVLSNAVKYNKPGGQVKISCKEIENDAVLIEVEDTGIGIPEEKKWRVFEPFDRLEKDKTSIEGTGIGMSISKSLAEQMGGSMWFESTQDKGTTFFLKFLLSKPKEDTEDEAILYENKESDNSLAPLKVLMVEDNLQNILLIENCLPLMGEVQLETATEGKTGIEMARSSQPDLILMDVNLPDISGLEALRILKEDESTKSIPVVGVSALALKQDCKNGVEQGFDSYLTKPLDINKLVSMINSYRKPVDSS